MAAKSHDSKIFPYNINYFIEELRSQNLSSELKISLVSENRETWGMKYRFHHGLSFWSYSEDISITLTPVTGNSTKVDILSECAMPTQIIDYGKNAKNVRSIFELLGRNIPLRVKNDINAPVDVQNIPIQSEAPCKSEAVCLNCNNTIDKDAVFCPTCGKRVQTVPTFKYCSKCGAKHNEVDKFCSACGSVL